LAAIVVKLKAKTKEKGTQAGLQAVIPLFSTYVNSFNLMGNPTESELQKCTKSIGKVKNR